MSASIEDMRSTLEDILVKFNINEFDINELADLLRETGCGEEDTKALVAQCSGSIPKGVVTAQEFLDGLFWDADECVRKHMLFICNRINHATDAAPLTESEIQRNVETGAGLMSVVTGAYGSLNFGVPLRLSSTARLARYWDRHGHAKLSTLVLRHLDEGEPESTINGVACMAYSDKELAAAQSYFSKDKKAEFVKLPVSSFEAVSWQKVPPHVEYIYCVVTPGAHEPPNFESPILQSYLEKISQSFIAYGEDFLEEFLKTTRGWSAYWLDDKRDDLADYTYEDADFSSHQVVDDIIAGAAPGSSCMVAPSFFVEQENPPTFPPEKTIHSGPIEQSKTNYFCFGMGSLINTPSRVGTAGKVAQCAIPVAIDATYDYCPCWNYQNHAGGSQLTAGGMVMRKDPRNRSPNAETAGVIYPGPSDEAKMAAQDEREVGYTRFNIPNSCIRSLGWQLIPEGITVFQYVPNTELPDDHKDRARQPDGSLAPRAPFPLPEYPLPQTYVDVCLLGCLEYSEKFAAKWIAGFVGWPSAENPFWLNDRPVSRRPWISQPRYDEVDTLLAKYIPDSLACRELTSEYGRHLRKHFTAGAKLNIKYSSYTAQSRKPTQMSTWSASHFIFHYAHRISSRQNAKIESGGNLDIGIPCRLKRTGGYRRSYCLHVEKPGSDFTSPSLVVDSDNARDVNGVLRAADKTWLDAGLSLPPAPDQDPFESIGMHRVEVSLADIEVLLAFVSLPPDTKVYTYIATSPAVPSYRFPIRQTLIDTTLNGCLEYGEDFCAEWVDSTDGWELPDGRCYWLNDRYIARRPWMGLGGKYKIFDRTVYESTSECVPGGVLMKRRLPEEYLLEFDAESL